MQWLTIVASLVGAYLLVCVFSLFRNYSIARKTGFEILVTPVNPSNPAWMVFSVAFRPVLQRFLPSALWERVKMGIYGWEFFDKYGVHEKLGPAFLYVNPGSCNELYVADAELADQISTRRKDFFQAKISILVMTVFGPNLVESNGEDWQRQRRLVAPNLNENISDLVWGESTKQAREMMSYYTAHSNGETNSMLDGLRDIAMNVLGSAGYGTPKVWGKAEEADTSGHKMSFLDAISAVTMHLVPAMLIPASILRLPIMPLSMQKLGHGLSEFPKHMQEMLGRERASAHTDTRNNMVRDAVKVVSGLPGAYLQSCTTPTVQRHANGDRQMSTLIRLSDEAASGDAKSSKTSLSEEEIYGNLFLFTAAGYDTTANTMGYTMILLASNPQWQKWIMEEIDQVMPDTADPDYHEIFPKLIRCLALMHEILRLYPPVEHISRTVTADQQVTLQGKTCIIPKDTIVYISPNALHNDPKYWGRDSLEFKPTRWLAKDQISLLTPKKGTFMAWNLGPRSCPGQKMSQVEFVSVMATIFKYYTVEPIVEKGETLDMAREKLAGVMADSQPHLTLQVNRPQDVKLRWTKR